MFEWNYYLLFIITIIAGWLSLFLRGLYTRKKSSREVDFWRFDFIQNAACLLGILFIYILSGAVSQFSLYSVILGVVLGLVTVFNLNFCLKSYAYGSFSYTTIIVSFSVIIPTFSGAFFGEKISLIQFLGVILMIFCIILSPSNSTDEPQAKFNFKWLAMSLASMFFGGCLGVVQKVHQSSQYHRNEMAALLITGFCISTIFSGIKFWSVLRKTKNEESNKGMEIKKNLLYIPAICGLVFAFPHTINLFLAGKFPAIILFPIVNIAPMLLTILSGVVIFKERLSLKNWMGIAVGLLSGMLLSGIINF